MFQYNKATHVRQFALAMAKTINVYTTRIYFFVSHPVKSLRLSIFLSERRGRGTNDNQSPLVAIIFQMSKYMHNQIACYEQQNFA